MKKKIVVEYANEGRGPDWSEIVDYELGAVDGTTPVYILSMDEEGIVYLFSNQPIDADVAAEYGAEDLDEKEE